MSYELRKCVECGKEFYVWTGKKYRKHGRNIRKRGSKTCSKDCSREYNRKRDGYNYTRNKKDLEGEKEND
ncbi:MAG: hypothetical protein ACOC56_05405 [Atribacterota bacterium]